MDIRSTSTVVPVSMHDNVKVWGLFPKFSLFEQTQGTYLEAIEEWTIAPHTKATPHSHDTHEFYYILVGEAVVQIEQEARRVKPGDLIYIPPKVPHSIWPTTDEGVRAFSFSVSYQAPVEPGYKDEVLDEVPVID